MTSQSPWLDRYPAKVPRKIDPREIPLGGLLQEAALRYPESVATIFYGARLRYRDVFQGSVNTAGFLARIGMGPGDRVALLIPNIPSFLLCYYGAVLMGCVAVPLNPLLSEPELEFQLRDSGAKVLFVAEPLVDKVSGVILRTEVRHVVVTSPANYVPFYLRPVVALKSRSHARLPAQVKVYSLEQEIKEARRFDGAAPRPTDPAVLLYTGGTTGICKAAVLTHSNLVANTDQIRAWLYALRPGKEVFVSVLPFFHSYGMTVGMNLAIDLAATMVLFPRFDALETVRAINKYGVTLMPGVPSMYLAVARSAERNRIDISSVKVCVSGGAPLPREIHDRFVAVTGAKLVEGYGLTEASPVTHVNPIWDGENRIGTIGLPIPNTECRVVDLETGTKDVPPGQEGELLIRGPQVMSGYWSRVEETTQVLRDGWLYTGDIAVMEPDGYFRIVDRKKDMIIVAGFNVYPREVEEVLFRHPAVEEAAIVGERHPVRGELVKAYVVLRKGVNIESSELIAFCRQNLAPYKVPRSVEFVAQLPKSAVGKTLRRELRK